MIRDKEVERFWKEAVTA